MKILRPQLEFGAFFERLREAEVRALLLDYDGTLAPFREARDEAVLYPGVREVLADILAQGGTRAVIVSGRAVADLLPLLGLSPPPELWGTHGWERRQPDGAYSLGDLPSHAAPALDGLVEALAAAGFPGQWERKPASVAVHWRGLPEDRREAIGRLTKDYWRRLAQRETLALKPFDGGLELSVQGRDKGLAVRTLLEELGPQACVAFLGDDLTDEDAFRALGTRGLAVLVRPEFRETAAHWWLRPPEELLTFLAEWRTACGAS